MQTNELSSELLRRLADFRPDGARVLSLFLNLDPSEFGTARARATEIKSLVDQADRCVREADGIPHDQAVALRQDVDRAREFLSGADFEGAHGFVFGNGLMANFLEEYYAKDRYGTRRALQILAHTFASGLVGPRNSSRPAKRPYSYCSREPAPSPRAVTNGR